MTTTQIIPSEACHFYHKDGTPCYEVLRKDGKGTRPTTLADARKMGLVRSVTRVINCAAKPGLENWRLVQMLHAALTLPRLEGEPLDAFAGRVIADSQAQSEKAIERGRSLHEAIECYILGRPFAREWNNHILAIEHTLQQQCGLDLLPADAEKSFATPRYGGKIDWKQGNTLADFKTKDRIEHGKKLAFDNHVMQLAAYAHGVGLSYQSVQPPCRALSIFVGVEDAKVMIYEWPSEDLKRGYRMFDSLLSYCEELEKYWSDQ